MDTHTKYIPTSGNAFISTLVILSYNRHRRPPPTVGFAVAADELPPASSATLAGPIEPAQFWPGIRY